MKRGKLRGFPPEPDDYDDPVQVERYYRAICRYLHEPYVPLDTRLARFENPAPCGCHAKGERVVRPTSLAGFERWYKAWMGHSTLCKIDGYRQHIPEFNITASRQSSLAQFWDVIHPEHADKRIARTADEIRKKNPSYGKPMTKTGRMERQALAQRAAALKKIR